MSASLPPSPSSSPAASRVALLTGAAVLAVSVSLHAVPQWLKGWIDPAWTMAALMVLDALVAALLVRSIGALRTAGLLLLLLAMVVLTRKQSFVALPSLLLYLTLAAVFASTLQRGRESIIARIARHSYPREMTPVFERYLHRLTMAWALLFLLLAATTAALALLAPFDAWSLFAYILSWAVMAAMFIGEWVVRRTLFPDLPAHTPLQTLASAITFGLGRRRPMRPAGGLPPRS